MTTKLIRAIVKTVRYIGKIEVAYFISSFPDVAGTEEERQKGSAPKGYSPAAVLLGHGVNNSMTVI